MLSVVWLAIGLFLMFGPVLWLAVSSFKTPANLVEFPPTFLPLDVRMAQVQGYDKPLPLYRARLEDGTEKVLAQVRREPSSVFRSIDGSRSARSNLPWRTTPNRCDSSISCAISGIRCS